MTASTYHAGGVQLERAPETPGLSAKYLDDIGRGEPLGGVLQEILDGLALMGSPAGCWRLEASEFLRVRVANVVSVRSDPDAVQVAGDAASHDLLSVRFGTGAEPHRDPTPFGGNFDDSGEYPGGQVWTLLFQPISQPCRVAGRKVDKLPADFRVAEPAYEIHLALEGTFVYVGPAFLQRVDQILSLPAAHRERLRASGVEATPGWGARGVGDLTPRKDLLPAAVACLG